MDQSGEQQRVRAGFISTPSSNMMGYRKRERSASIGDEGEALQTSETIKLAKKKKRAHTEKFFDKLPCTVITPHRIQAGAVPGPTIQRYGITNNLKANRDTSSSTRATMTSAISSSSALAAITTGIDDADSSGSESSAPTCVGHGNRDDELQAGTGDDEDKEDDARDRHEEVSDTTVEISRARYGITSYCRVMMAIAYMALVSTEWIRSLSLTILNALVTDLIILIIQDLAHTYALSFVIEDSYGVEDITMTAGEAKWKEKKARESKAVAKKPKAVKKKALTAEQLAKKAQVDQKVGSLLKRLAKEVKREHSFDENLAMLLVDPAYKDLIYWSREGPRKGETLVTPSLAEFWRRRPADLFARQAKKLSSFSKQCELYGYTILRLGKGDYKELSHDALNADLEIWAKLRAEYKK